MDTSQEFTDIPIDLSSEDQCILIERYIAQHLQIASVSLFHSCIEDGYTFEEALFAAISNEAILDILRSEIEHQKSLQKVVE